MTDRLSPSRTTAGSEHPRLYLCPHVRTCACGIVPTRGPAPVARDAETVQHARHVPTEPNCVLFHMLPKSCRAGEAGGTVQIGPGTRRTKASLRFSPSHPHVQGELCSPGRGHPRFSCTSDSSCSPPPHPPCPGPSSGCSFLRSWMWTRRAAPARLAPRSRWAGEKRRSWGGWGGGHWGLFSTRSVSHASWPPAPGTLCAAGFSSSSGVSRGLDQFPRSPPNSLNPKVNHHLNNVLVFWFFATLI